MNARKRVVRHGLTGGGFVTLVLAGTFLISLGLPPSPSTFVLISWLALVGGTMLLAGLRERVSIGSRTVGWPRVAAVAVSMLAVGWGGVSLVSLLAGDGVTGLGPIEVVITLGMVGYFAWFARECWAGGVVIAEETFTVD
ncbi:hypothetical protein [Natronorubrum halophilum]|uniref:hypothetical protein n=1 Tax=Natronorubrum halophilum TaxID=1702106 RepID=UPI0010C18CCF|nr:hypothetical protein [Natronorubrum halophilum]